MATKVGDLLLDIRIGLAKLSTDLSRAEGKIDSSTRKMDLRLKDLSAPLAAIRSSLGQLGVAAGTAEGSAVALVQSLMGVGGKAGLIGAAITVAVGALVYFRREAEKAAATERQFQALNAKFGTTRAEITSVATAFRGVGAAVDRDVVQGIVAAGRAAGLSAGDMVLLADKIKQTADITGKDFKDAASDAFREFRDGAADALREVEAFRRGLAEKMSGASAGELNFVKNLRKAEAELDNVKIKAAEVRATLERGAGGQTGSMSQRVAALRGVEAQGEALISAHEEIERKIQKIKEDAAESAGYEAEEREGKETAALVAEWNKRVDAAAAAAKKVAGSKPFGADLSGLDEDLLGLDSTLAGNARKRGDEASAARAGQLQTEQALAQLKFVEASRSVDAMMPKLDALREKGEAVRNAFLSLADSMADAFSETITAFLVNPMQEALETVKALVNQMIEEIIKAIIKALVLKAVMAATGLSEGGSTGGMDPMGALFTAIGLAGGGRVRGPGGPTGDHIPAWLSDGEYVVNSAAVSRYGAGFMEAINSMALPRFAAGGLVAAGPASAAGGTVIVNETRNLMAIDLQSAADYERRNGGSARVQRYRNRQGGLEATLIRKASQPPRDR